MTVTDPQLIATHPELHHYTTAEGLKGIVDSNTLWATHFSQLNDATELKVLRQPLIDVLVERCSTILRAKRGKKFGLRKTIRKTGGLGQTSTDIANALVDTLYEVTFEAKGDIDFGEPFIASFCSHATEQAYEKANGLLSQWRGYGGQGRYCIVFDTAGIADLLAREEEAHFYSHVNLDAVHYAKDNTSVAEVFPGLLERCEQILAGIAEEGEIPAGQAFGPFVSGATLFKHQGFREEQEVRIVALRGSERLLEAETKLGSSIRPIKTIHTNDATKKRYIRLFETLGAKLPIKRVIVGPSRHQAENYGQAKGILGGSVNIRRSETPFIG